MKFQVWALHVFQGTWGLHGIISWASGCGDSFAWSPTLLQAVTVPPWPLSPAIPHIMEQAQPRLSNIFQRMHSLWCKNASHSFHTFFTGEKQHTRIPEEAWALWKTWLSHTTLKWQTQVFGAAHSVLLQAGMWHPRFERSSSVFSCPVFVKCSMHTEAMRIILKCLQFLDLSSLIFQNCYLQACPYLECNKLCEVLFVVCTIHWGEPWNVNFELFGNEISLW